MLTKEQKAMLERPINQAFIKQNQYDKFGNGNYVPADIYVRGMNEIFGPTNWGYKIVDKEDNEQYVSVRVAIQVNGNWIREEYGSAKKDKKDNSSVANAALSFALKKCISRLGMFPNMEEQTWDIPLFAPAPKPKVSQADLKEKIDELKGAYGIQSKDEFVKFAQIWNKDITKYEDLNPAKFLELYDYVQENEKAFENWNEVAV